MQIKFKIKLYIIVLLVTVIFTNITTYARANKTEEDKVEVLYLLGIIDDKDNLDEPVTRAEFAKMIVKSSDSKDKMSSSIDEAVANDVKNDNPYAGYIKEAINKKYMFVYLGGFFKPDEYTAYSDLTRAMLSLLGYTSDDFIGNLVYARNQKFESLGLNENIDKVGLDILMKRDIVNGIYNTLKEKKKDTDKVYGTLVFNKLIIDSDNELNADDVIETKVEGPFVIKNISDITAPFEITDKNVYLNGIISHIDEVKSDIINFGYAIFYLDLDRKYVYAYTERDDVRAPIRVEKGYVSGIYYSANDLTTPYRVDIGLNKYMIESEDMKLAFSSVGTIREDDYIVYLSNKMNDVTNAYLDADGNVVHNNDESELYNGSIINAFKYNLFK